jgi:hypothetical protein
MVAGQPVTFATAPSPQKATDVRLAPQVASVVVMFEVAVTALVLTGVKPAVAVHVSPAFRVTASGCPPPGLSSESENGDPGAPKVNVPGTFPVLDSVSIPEDAGTPMAAGANVKDSSGEMASVAPAGVADSPMITWVWLGSFV